MRRAALQDLYSRVDSAGKRRRLPDGLKYEALVSPRRRRKLQLVKPLQHGQGRGQQSAAAVAAAGEVKPEPAYSNVETWLDRETNSHWCFLAPKVRPCFTPELLADLAAQDAFLEAGRGRMLDSQGAVFQPAFAVVASRHPRVFNLGGDLALFLQLINRRDREGLQQYAHDCIMRIWNRLRHYGGHVMTIAVLQGNALGGGFECALANDVLIAEEGVRMGLPEILFNLFPGMGAYSLLARRVGADRAERLISQGVLYTAEEMKELGVVDLVVPKGTGIEAAREFMRATARRANGLLGMYRCREMTAPVTLEELLHIGEVWTDAAMRLEECDLRMMEKLVKSQTELERKVALA